MPLVILDRLLVSWHHARRVAFRRIVRLSLTLAWANMPRLELGLVLGGCRRARSRSVHLVQVLV